ncbi:MAG: stage III sporulation protein AA [Cellulosilyticaceae bacterium]
MKESLLRIMPQHLRTMLNQISNSHWETMQEIRLRIGQGMLLVSHDEVYGLGSAGLCKVELGYVVGEQDIQSILKFISGFSMYALEDDIRQGYITIEGGHRVGIVGKAIIENKEIKTLKNIGAMNIRISHEVMGCSQKVLPYILGRGRVYHTLIVSPPKCGKTTLLRDVVRSLSCGYSGYGPYTVGVVDERSEIAGCYMGIPQNDVGPRTDVLDGCPKVEGMRMLLRAMAPDVIAVDEIGSQEDAVAIEDVLGAGVSILCTTHGNDVTDCYKKPGIRRMIQNKMIERIIVLSQRRGPCTIEEIIDTSKMIEKVTSL